MASPSDAARPPAAAARNRLWICTAAALVLLAGGAALRILRSKAAAGLAGYESGEAVFQQEYRKCYGLLMTDPNGERLFREAAAAVRGHDYPAAMAKLQEASREAPLPVVFNDLAVLHMEAGDRQRSALAFREALARDSSNLLVQRNLVEIGGFNLDQLGPMTAEQEPNNSLDHANLIATGQEVRAEISGGTADIDCFSFVVPPAPRDHVEVEVVSLSPTLELAYRLYDGDMRLLHEQRPAAPGGRTHEFLAAPPNTTWYLEIWGAHGTFGDYAVLVRPQRLFDRYETNDDIFSAARIEVGVPAEANLMDADDVDFYSFESPRDGTVSIDIENQSLGLIPALTTFSPDKRNSGFGPDIRNPGESLHHTMAVQAHQVYYLQVWSLEKTFGTYRLTVR
jgi:hypothetical protein